MNSDQVIFFLEAEQDCQRLGVSTIALTPAIVKKYSQGEFYSSHKLRQRFSTRFEYLGITYQAEFVLDNHLIRVQRITVNEIQ